MLTVPRSFIPRRRFIPSSSRLLLPFQTTTTTRSLTTSPTLTMRIPYIPDPPPPSFSPSDLEIVDRVRARRSPRPLQSLDLALLHSPAVADGWNSFLGAIRTKTDSLDAGLREIAISRVAVVNRAWYEWMHHAPLAIQAGVSKTFMEDYVKGRQDLGSITEEEKAALSKEGRSGHDAGGKGVGEKEWAVLRYTDEMTRNVHVPDEVFENVKKLCGEKEVVELTAVIACYNCVSRFLVALDVGERNGTQPDALSDAHH